MVFFLEDINSSQLNTKTISTKITDFKTSRKTKLSNKFNIVYGTTTTLPLKSKFVDKVIIMNSFHHFDTKEMMLAEIYRTLKPNGMFLITDHISLDKSKQSLYACDRNYFLLNEKDLTKMFEEANFKLVSITKMAKQTRQFVFQNTN